jgi:hypothetical protein
MGTALLFNDDRIEWMCGKESKFGCTSKIHLAAKKLKTMPVVNERVLKAYSFQI